MLSFFSSTYLLVLFSLIYSLALVLFSDLCFSQFCSGKYNFGFPLFSRSIYFTLFLLDCFDFAHECICIHVYSVTLLIVVLNLWLYIGLLQVCGVFFFFFFLLPVFFLFFIILIFKFLFKNYFKNFIYFIFIYLYLYLYFIFIYFYLFIFFFFFFLFIYFLFI